MSYHLLDAEIAATRAVNEGRLYPFRKQEFINGFLEGRAISMDQHNFNQTIGELDRLLSAFLLLLENDTDQVNRKTLKHHADDLIGVGNTMLEKLGKKLPNPLPPETVKALEEFKTEMVERVIPDIQRALEERADLAQEVRSGTRG